ncbi:metal ABC transporter ATP-binding protein [Arthrobacter sp. UM1]|uniref:metal ABC transporter ATP-binding protein n=1 Tax=Arthrobacter sp. UM1 TaxID=2766776 RepID=UPI001CF6BB81|nr:metal ABC transporter ATP-binding protein [Arthrobacter sp. UM1]MCB4208643.1 metal ABC transporter ATP-binding protein [Arthrobacter sp. UM1]
MRPAIRVRGLTVRYGDVVALKDLSLAVPAGQVTALVGMNGSGKSTLFNAITGRLRPDASSVEIAGMPPAAARARGLLACVPQSEEVDWSFPLSVEEVVMTGRYGLLGLTRRPRAADREAVRVALERAGLSRLGRRQVGSLSGGQRKRVFVARAIAQDARILLLDEPFAGVDRGSEAAVTGLLRELAASGRTVLVATHGLASLPRLADEAVLLRRKVLYQGPVREAVRPERLALAFGLDPAGEAPA